MEQSQGPKIVSESELFSFLRSTPVWEQGMRKPNKQRGGGKSVGGGARSECDKVAGGLCGKQENKPTEPRKRTVVVCAELINTGPEYRVCRLISRTVPSRAFWDSVVLVEHLHNTSDPGWVLFLYCFAFPSGSNTKNAVGKF